MVNEDILAAMSKGIGSDFIFLLKYAGSPPQSTTPSFDIGSLVNVASIVTTILGILITVVGILFSIYFFYRTQAEKPVGVYKSIDPAINVLEIQRVPLSEASWQDTIFRLEVNNDRIQATRAMLTFVTLTSWLTALIALLPFVSPAKRAATVVPLPFLLISLAFLIFVLEIDALTSDKRKELGTTPEESRYWLMDHAEMYVLADYNYLLAKAHWSLKQMNASIITVNSDSVEGILQAPLRLVKYGKLFAEKGKLEISIIPDPEEPGVCLIVIDYSSILQRKDEFLKGRYTNNFLDLMGSGGFPFNNQPVS